jgi:hypothetical protein
MARPGCTCGSGAHPRKCELHPAAYALHVAMLNVENVCQDQPRGQDRFNELDEAIGAMVREQSDERVIATAARIERAIAAVLEQHDVSLVTVAADASRKDELRNEQAYARALEAALVECRKGRV